MCGSSYRVGGWNLLQIVWLVERDPHPKHSAGTAEFGENLVVRGESYDEIEQSSSSFSRGHDIRVKIFGCFGFLLSPPGTTYVVMGPLLQSLHLELTQ